MKLNEDFVQVAISTIFIIYYVIIFIFNLFISLFVFIVTSISSINDPDLTVVMPTIFIFFYYSVLHLL